MKVTIKDIDILQTLQPSQVAAYLSDRGWQQQQYIPQKAIIWRKEINLGNAVAVILPLHPDTPGFPVSMSVMLETLETIEARSQLDILRDLLAIVPNVTMQDDALFGVKG
ncbi:hypothetical protein [Laspinema palackyanum]|uniref:hypothetical protein n=1 Tax=Laspinema palackyanum TaxID=3231601 RepID=UPI00345C7B0B|nr:hypothetical protein [Laspinema sp. D2c]